MSLAHRLDRAMKNQAEDGLKDFQALSAVEMGETCLAFGKAHAGRRFSEIWELEQGWVNWFVKTYSNSSKIEHRKMLIYVERKVEEIEHLNQMEPLTNPSSQAILQPKSKASAKARANPRPPWELASNTSGISDPWDAVDETVEALQGRMMSVENALTEIMNHLRQQTWATAIHWD